MKDAIFFVGVQFFFRMIQHRNQAGRQMRRQGWDNSRQETNAWKNPMSGVEIAAELIGD